MSILINYFLLVGFCFALAAGLYLGLDKIPIREQLSIDNNIISTKVTTGNAPNNLEIISNIVEDAYAISEKNFRNIC